MCPPGVFGMVYQGNINSYGFYMSLSFRYCNMLLIDIHFENDRRFYNMRQIF